MYGKYTNISGKFGNHHPLKRVGWKGAIYVYIYCIVPTRVFKSWFMSCSLGVILLDIWRCYKYNVCIGCIGWLDVFMKLIKHPFFVSHWWVDGFGRFKTLKSPKWKGLLCWGKPLLATMYPPAGKSWTKPLADLGAAWDYLTSSHHVTPKKMV